MKRTKMRTWRSLGLLVGCLILSLQLAACGGDSDGSSGNPAGGTDSGSGNPIDVSADPYVPTGFPQVVVVSGTDYEMGVQYGQQAARAILHNVAIFKSKLYDQYGSDTVTKDMQVWDYYLQQYDPTLKDWTQGIADGCKQMGANVSYLDLIAVMVYPTELWSRPLAPYPAETGVTAAAAPRVAANAAAGAYYHSCNTFAATGAATPDGKPIHGITSMTGTEMMDQVILLAFPTDGASFVSATFAGRVNGNFGMNSNGLAWTMTAILADSPAWGLTEVYFHWLAQEAESIDTAVNYIESTPAGGVAGGFTLTDGSGNVRVLETISLVPQLSETTFGEPETHSNLRSPGDAGESGPWVVQTNHLVPEWMQEYNPFWLSFIGTYTRNDTVSQFLTEAAPGTVDFAFAKAMFASDDWYDAAEGVWHRNEPGAPGISNDHSSTAQSIFFPADRIAYLSPGTPSGNGLPTGATGEYVKIQLATDPKPVTQQADVDAEAFYWEAVDLLEHDLNARADYLTTPLQRDVEDKLDEAMIAYSSGMEKAASANLETDAGKKLTLWSSALTYYAKAQLYAQMAKTTLVRASGE